MLSDSPQRDRLTHLCYRDQNPQSWFAQAEQALQQIAAIEPVQKKFQSAIRHGKVAAWLDVPQQVQAAVGAGVLSAEEGQAFLAFEKLRHEVIKVGEFSFDLKTVLN
jgi:acyl-CoA dehydrogenase